MFKVEGSVRVLRSKLKVLLPMGLLMLSGGLILHNWTHGGYIDFASGFLIGMSIVFLIASRSQMGRDIFATDRSISEIPFHRIGCRDNFQSRGAKLGSPIIF